MSFLLRARNNMSLYNLPLWRSGLDAHLSWEHPGFNPSSSLVFFYLFLEFYRVTYVILVRPETEG